jgi:hypothetical protein
MRQLIDEPKPVYEVGFIRKEKLQLEQCSALELTAQVKAGAFGDILTLGLVGSFH